MLHLNGILHETVSRRFDVPETPVDVLDIWRMRQRVFLDDDDDDDEKEMAEKDAFSHGNKTQRGLARARKKGQPRTRVNLS